MRMLEIITALIILLTILFTIFFAKQEIQRRRPRTRTPKVQRTSRRPKKDPFTGLKFDII